MKSCLLPHEITYYHRIGTGSGVSFSRIPLSPVRLRCLHRENAQTGQEVVADLYIFPSETVTLLPRLSPAGDYFVRGLREAEEPPRDGSAFRVTGVTYFDATGDLSYIHVKGVANRGECDGE